MKIKQNLRDIKRALKQLTDAVEAMSATIDIETGDDVVQLIVDTVNSDHPVFKTMDLIDSRLLLGELRILYPDPFARYTVRQLSYKLRKSRSLIAMRMRCYIPGERRNNMTLWCVRNYDRYVNLSEQEIYERFKTQEQMASLACRAQGVNFL